MSSNQINTERIDLQQHDSNREFCNEPEALLRKRLYEASQLENINLGPHDEETESSFLWSLLTNDIENDNIRINESVNSWMILTRSIKPLLPYLSSPFDVHHLVMEASSLYCDNESGSSKRRTYSCLLLLLCVYALRQQEEYFCANQNKRYKRWRSLLCETIRLFQNTFLKEEDENEEEEYEEEDSEEEYEEEDSERDNSVDTAVDLWIHHVLPACLEVYKSLPTREINHVPLLAGMVGTSTRLVSQYFSIMTQQANVDKMKDAVELFFNAIQTVLLGHDEQQNICSFEEMLSFPAWRNTALTRSSNEETDLIMYQTNLVWWTQYACKDESVADMGTSWNPVGVALWASCGFDKRPIAWSSQQVWRLWFPHVKVLLAEQGSARAVGFELLHKLLHETPRHFLTFQDAKSDPASPIGVFELLSSYIMEQAGTKNQSSEQPAAVPTTVVTTLMKSLLSKYTACSQVEIVKVLVSKCPYPGFVPRLLDMLRPLVTMDTNKASQDALWAYLATHIQQLNNFCDSGWADTNLLMERLEVYVSVISMLQLRQMVKKNNNEDGNYYEPSSIRTMQEQLQAVHDSLSHALEIWSSSQKDNSGATTNYPPDFYRLYLLQDALQQVVSNDTPKDP